MLDIPNPEWLMGFDAETNAYSEYERLVQDVRASIPDSSYHEYPAHLKPAPHVYKPSLARLARACKSFEDPALNVLHEEIDCFAALLTCLPEDLWTVEGPWLRLTFHRELLETDWDILARHTARVRILHQGSREEDHGKFPPWPEVWEALNLCPIPVLFPRLHTLNCWMWTPEHVLCGRYLFGPQLRNIRFSMTTGELLERIPDLATLCPLLESIELGTVLDHPSLSFTSDAFTNVVRQYPCLRTLDLGRMVVLPGDVMHSLAQLPTFRHLRVLVLESSDWIYQETRVGLRNLHSLALDAQNWDVATITVKLLLGDDLHTARVRLSKLDVTCYNSPTLRGLSAFLGALVDCISPLDVTRLTLLVVRVSDCDWTQLLALSQLRNLTRVSLLMRPSDSTEFMSLSGDSLYTLVRGWLLLEHLTIGYGFSPIPLRNFVTVLSLCPRIKSANIDVDVCNDPDDVIALAAEGYLGVRNEYIKMLQLGPPRKLDAGRGVPDIGLMRSVFARYPIVSVLHHLFPNLNEFEHHFGVMPPPGKSVWAAVEAELEAMRGLD
ncbi:hypothetical protein CONPUDRAFT_166753 [Coniophora puteana RWD-64-598 SS2]|uniref:F-box domain-containing protein n=1 Tax=Coniophora puteana (strain RWD-64-598) TaxID=741705 RepID=A0A5M3MJA3_CONPW|nr:uncharacterized protein CONPUDRAFT_166753 [Coniophora puteana RWD-64-598 SS2]EIW78874.1 hypothetical protein CONPUDRAFT_166753 [Coniophora puteana RWD-64-598 SS2]